MIHLEDLFPVGFSVVDLAEAFVDHRLFVNFTKLLVLLTLNVCVQLGRLCVLRIESFDLIDIVHGRHVILIRERELCGLEELSDRGRLVGLHRRDLFTRDRLQILWIREIRSHVFAVSFDRAVEIALFLKTICSCKEGFASSNTSRITFLA